MRPRHSIVEPHVSNWLAVYLSVLFTAQMPWWKAGGIAYWQVEPASGGLAGWPADCGAGWLAPVSWHDRKIRLQLQHWESSPLRPSYPLPGCLVSLCPALPGNGGILRAGQSKHPMPGLRGTSHYCKDNSCIPTTNHAKPSQTQGAKAGTLAGPWALDVYILS